MTQIAQLSEAEIEDRFHVTGTRPVAFMLAGFVKERDGFSVQFGNGQLFLTRLLAVDADKGSLIFDCSGSADVNRRFGECDRAVLVGRPGGIHVQFVVTGPREVNFQGAKAFAVVLPKFLVRLQRREYFRIETPRIRPVEFFGRMPNGSLLKLPAHDLSVSGLGVTAVEWIDGLEPGLALANCHCRLPDEAKDLFFDASINHITEQEGRTGVKQWRIGLSFKNLPANEEAHIQRYIARVERERHELL